MPDTLGVTALPADYDAGLTGGLSEDPYDLFKADGTAIQTLDRAVGDSSPETIAELMREIDRAYDAFDLMAVSHGWHAASGLSAEEHLPAVPAESFDLADFVADVAEAETGQTSTTQDEIRLPASWAHGLDGLPGFDAARCVMRFTRNPETWRDHEGRDLGYLGRAHPLVLRAIRHGCGLNGAVTMGCHDYLALLLTSEIEIRVSHRVMFRQIVAIIATPDRPPVEIDRWLAVGDAESTVTAAGVWDRLFASWSERAQSKSRDLLSRIASRRHKAFVARYDKMNKQQTAQSRRWLRVKANIFCGPFTPSTGDLFGVPDTGPAWRVERDPLTRLISFATDPATAAAKRREANEVIATFQGIEPASTMPGPIVSRPLGMLMLVPRNGP
jgi:hypothetical protein